MEIKVAHITDTHIGITNPKSLVKMFRKLALETFDLLVHTGDFCGGLHGSRSVQVTLAMIRQEMPDVAFAATVGNHDYWRVMGRRKHLESRPSVQLFEENYQEIKASFLSHQVHFIDEDGPYRMPTFPGLAFVGHSGWYAGLSPNTNDFNWMPIGMGGDTHRSMQKRAYDGLFRNLDMLQPTDKNVVFVSHFPVVNPLNDEEFHKFGWSTHISEMMAEQYACRVFMNGHAHQLHQGPLRFEPGTDYRKPTYRIWTFEF